MSIPPIEINKITRKTVRIPNTEYNEKLMRAPK